MQSILSLNMRPIDIYRSSSWVLALETAQRYGFSLDRLMLVLTEAERFNNPRRLAETMRSFANQGLIAAIDDFGAGFAGFGLFVEFQPSVVKIDMGFVRHIDTDSVRRAIVKGFVTACSALHVRVEADGVERPGELAVLRNLGATFFQGHLVASSAVGAPPEVMWEH